MSLTWWCVTILRLIVDRRVEVTFKQRVSVFTVLRNGACNRGTESSTQTSTVVSIRVMGEFHVLAKTDAVGALELMAPVSFAKSMDERSNRDAGDVR